MSLMAKKTKNNPNTFKILAEWLKDFAFDAAGAAEAFLLSAGSSRLMMRRMRLNSREYQSAIYSLKKSGYIKRTNEDQFLITPKAIKKIRMLKVEESDWRQKEWDGRWRIVVFDIPEPKRRERNILRSLLKRKGFIGLQNSVFVAPYADFDDLNLMRSELGIEKYVNFFVAKSAGIDDDRLLREKFGLNSDRGKKVRK